MGDKVLINISHTYCSKWDKIQTVGWDKIIEYHTPTIRCEMTLEKIKEEVARAYTDVMSETKETDDLYWFIQGEPEFQEALRSFCRVIFKSRDQFFKEVFAKGIRGKISENGRIINSFSFHKWSAIINSSNGGIKHEEIGI